MQYRIEIVKEAISTSLNDRKEGKKQIIEWLLSTVMVPLP